MAFQVHQINRNTFVKTPTTRDPAPVSYPTLAAAEIAQRALGGISDPVNGAYWNSCVFDTNSSSAPTLQFKIDED